ncbi:MAG: hypothetical protein ACI84R_003462, partial [Candidatus Azotimanducaceae bacterium]
MENVFHAFLHHQKLTPYPSVTAISNVEIVTSENVPTTRVRQQKLMLIKGYYLIEEHEWKLSSPFGLSCNRQLKSERRSFERVLQSLLTATRRHEIGNGLMEKG